MDEQEKESPIILKLRALMLGTSHPIMDEQKRTDDAANVDAQPAPPAEPPANMADGGEVDTKPVHSGVEKDAQELSPAAQVLNEVAKRPTKISLTNPNPIDHNNAAKGLFVTHRFADGGVVPSEDEKRQSVLKHIKENPPKMADGGMVPAQDPDKLQTILQTLGMAGKDAINSITAPMRAVTAPAMAVANSPAVPDAVNTLGMAAKDLTGVDVPKMDVPAPAPAPQAAIPQPAAPHMPPSAPAPAAPSGSAAPAQPSMDFNNLFNQDPSKIAQGFNPADRQKAAQDVWNQQHTVGSMISEALAGLGDAVAAKGGVNQDMLAKLISTQAANRAETMGNFDKARDAAVQNFQMKTQMGENAIKMLAAKDSYGPASPAMIKLLNGMGIQVAPGALNKDLPQYFAAAKMKADQAMAHSDMLLKATKQAAEEEDSYEKDPGFMHSRHTAEEREARIKERAADLMAQGQGMVRIMLSDKSEHYIPAANLEKAKKMDRGLKVVQ